MISTKMQAPPSVLCDTSTTGRVRPWRDKKVANELLSLAYDSINPAKAERLRDCATWLTYRVADGGSKTLDSANFCRVRLCPICLWRRSLKLYKQVERILTGMHTERTYGYVLLTLTVRNCDGAELGATLDDMMRAWNRMTKYKTFVKAVKGWYRGLEITHNVDIDSVSYDTYHPHFHVLLAVNKTYFTSKEYIRHDDWQSLWARAACLDYSPQVDVRKVKGNTLQAIAEVAKYPTKSAEYIIPYDWDLTTNTVQLLDNVLNNRRFAAFGGIMKEWHKRLNLDDVETGDLLHADDDLVAKDDIFTYVSYFWFTGYRQYMQGEIEG